MYRLLLPLSWLYTLVVSLRNRLFDFGLLPSYRPSVATLSIGNLAVGGTGKTPHTEFLARHFLSSGLRVAILSRGYGRTTRGYRSAGPASTSGEVGDEPLQMFRRFGGRVQVAVCERRAAGLQRLEAEAEAPDVVLLDDAFQHRYVKPHFSLLLTDWSRLYSSDHVLPAGRLRESRQGARRADVIIVSKCPPALSEAERRAIVERLQPTARQRVFFSTMVYAPLALPSECHSAVLLTGIARPEPLAEHLAASGIAIERHLRYPDHHRFSLSDLRDIIHILRSGSCIVTTAKDYARLLSAGLPPELVQHIIVQEVGIGILFNQENEFLSCLERFKKPHRGC